MLCATALDLPRQLDPIIEEMHTRPADADQLGASPASQQGHTEQRIVMRSFECRAVDVSQVVFHGWQLVRRDIGIVLPVVAINPVERIRAGQQLVLDGIGEKEQIAARR